MIESVHYCSLWPEPKRSKKKQTEIRKPGAVVAWSMTAKGSCPAGQTHRVGSSYILHNLTIFLLSTRDFGQQTPFEMSMGILYSTLNPRRVVFSVISVSIGTWHPLATVCMHQYLVSLISSKKESDTSKLYIYLICFQGE